MFIDDSVATRKWESFDAQKSQEILKKRREMIFLRINSRQDWSREK